MAWLRVLENVLVVADTSKLHRAMGDQWCLTICRCLSSLLRSKGEQSAPSSPPPVPIADRSRRQGDGDFAAGRRGRSAPEPDPRHTGPRHSQCPLTRRRVPALF